MTNLTHYRDAYARARADTAARRLDLLRAIARERASGRTLEDIGDELGVTRFRVSKLAKQADALAESDERF
jgi:predicted transcriptional regulator